MRAFTLSAALAVASVACLPLAYTFAGPVTVNFGSTGDNFMYSSMGNYNWGSWEHIIVGPNLTTNGPPYRGLLHTDIGSLASVPNISVQSATLTLTISSVAKRGTLANYDVELYLLDDSNAGWVEGTGNADVVNGASSWNYLAYSTTPWTGGAGVGASVGSAGLHALLGTATIVPASMAVDDKVSFQITSPEGIAALQSWATGGTNAGFFLKTSTDTGTTNADWGAVYFGSKENVTVSRQPVLSVDYTTPIALGDVIGVDFASAGGSATGFNVFNSNATIADGSVLRNNGGTVVHGVSLSFSGGNGFTNPADTAGWIGASSDPYYGGQETALRDIVYASGLGSALTLTFSGLDDALSYDMRVYSLFDRSDIRDRQETISVTDGLDTRSVTTTRYSRWLATTLEDGGTLFEQLKTDGNGNLVVTVTGPVGNNPFLNAIVLQAVPEPSTALMLPWAVLAVLGFRRRGKR
ncbi:MAG: hypothetical protein U1E05_13950 [Patescibacteria group bacterium]|nr:hypothetical protein [Patescibacteria group bacterium]